MYPHRLPSSSVAPSVLRPEMPRCSCLLGSGLPLDLIAPTPCLVDPVPQTEASEQVVRAPRKQRGAEQSSSNGKQLDTRCPLSLSMEHTERACLLGASFSAPGANWTRSAGSIRSPEGPPTAAVPGFSPGWPLSSGFIVHMKVTLSSWRACPGDVCSVRGQPASQRGPRKGRSQGQGMVTQETMWTLPPKSAGHRLGAGGGPLWVSGRAAAEQQRTDGGQGELGRAGENGPFPLGPLPRCSSPKTGEDHLAGESTCDAGWLLSQASTRATLRADGRGLGGAGRTCRNFVPSMSHLRPCTCSTIHLPRVPGDPGPP